MGYNKNLHQPFYWILLNLTLLVICIWQLRHQEMISVLKVFNASNFLVTPSNYRKKKKKRNVSWS